MNLRKAHDRSVNALQRQGRLLRNTGEREIRRHHMVFGRQLTRRSQSGRTRGDDEGPIRTGEHGTQGFDGMFVDLAVLLEFREVVDEGQVNDGIRSGGAAPQARTSSNAPRCTSAPAAASA